MSAALKTIGMVVGAVALIATGVGAFAVAGSALATTAASVATFANLAAAAASLGAALLAKAPPARGSVSQVLIGSDVPQPYAMGEGLVGGVRRHDAGYGAALKKVPNPYRWMVDVYSGGGPVQSITPYVDQAAVAAWYTGFLDTDTQLGACPESTALVPPRGTAPGWGATSKLSGQAAVGWNLKFDKDGKRFASGIPQLAAYGQWVKVYDPRLDSTFAGGSGAHRINNEATWAWSENPALHAATYVYGRHQNGVRTLGVGLPAEGIDLVAVAAWASVCEANDWTIFGVVYEPGDKWGNLRDICAAGGGEPVFARGVLSFRWHAPQTALDTVTEADFADADQSVTKMASWRERVNTVIPKYRSPAHDWELVAAEAVDDAGYITEDGQVKQIEWPFNLVKNLDQATQLAAYKLYDSREVQPIVLTLGPRLRGYRPGECLTLDLPSLDLDCDAIILEREIDPASMTVRFTMIAETPGKHTTVLGTSGTAPPTVSTVQDGQDRDELAAAATLPFGWQSSIIRSAAAKNPRNTSDVAQAMLSAADVGSNVTITVSRHDWDYPSGTADVTRALGTITGLAFSTYYYVYFDDETLTNTSPTYAVTTDPGVGMNSTDNPDRHPLGQILTPANGAAATTGGGNLGYGFDFNFWLF